MEQGGENKLKWRNGFFVEIAGVVACTSRVVKMKEHLSFCREFSLLCIEDRVAVDHVV